MRRRDGISSTPIPGRTASWMVGIVAVAGAGCGYDTLAGLDLYAPGDAGRSGAVSDAGGSDDAVGTGERGVIDGGPGTSTGQISCGSSGCAIPAESCCIGFSQGPPETLDRVCVSGSDCPIVDSGPSAGQPGVALKCSGSSNCQVGTICCIARIQNAVASRCRKGCGTGEAQLCDPAAPVSGCSSVSGACANANIASWDLPPSYASCGDVVSQ